MKQASLPRKMDQCERYCTEKFYFLLFLYIVFGLKSISFFSFLSSKYFLSPGIQPATVTPLKVASEAVPKIR